MDPTQRKLEHARRDLSLNEVQWTPVACTKTLRKWANDGTDEPKYLEAVTVWTMICDRAAREGKDVYQMKFCRGAILLSVEFMRLVWDGETDEITSRMLRTATATSLAEYLTWERCDLGKFCFRLEELVEYQRIKRKYPLVRKVLENKIGEGDMKAVELWHKSMGRLQGEMGAKEAYTVTVVDEYKDGVTIEKNVAMNVKTELDPGRPVGQIENNSIGIDEVVEALDLDPKPKTENNL